MDMAQSLKQAEHAVEKANCLVRAQEALVAKMNMLGLDAKRAEALLAAFREGARLAEEQRQRLEFVKSDP